MLLGTQEHIEVWELLPEGGAERATSGTQKHITLRERLSYSRHPEGDYCPGATHQADSQSLAARTHATLASRVDDVEQKRHLAEQKADLAEQQVACLEESLQVAKKMRAATHQADSQSLDAAIVAQVAANRPWIEARRTGMIATRLDELLSADAASSSTGSASSQLTRAKRLRSPTPAPTRIPRLRSPTRGTRLRSQPTPQPKAPPTLPPKALLREHAQKAAAERKQLARQADQARQEQRQQARDYRLKDVPWRAQPKKMPRLEHAPTPEPAADSHW